eukprot:1899398-Pyramimonas_sp.AAC.1
MLSGFVVGCRRRTLGKYDLPCVGASWRSRSGFWPLRRRSTSVWPRLVYRAVRPVGARISESRSWFEPCGLRNQPGLIGLTGLRRRIWP